MEEQQLRLGDDGEVIEIGSSALSKGKRKKLARGSRSFASQIRRMIVFGLLVTFVMMFSFLMGKGVIDLDPSQFAWYRQLCISTLGKNRLAFTIFNGPLNNIYLTDDGGSRNCVLVYKEYANPGQW